VEPFAAFSRRRSRNLCVDFLIGLTITEPRLTLHAVPEALSTTSIVILLTVVPGYLTVLWWSRSRTWRGFPADLHTVLQSLALSLVLQLVLLPFLLVEIYPVRDHLVDHPFRVAGWAFLGLFVLPYVLGTGAGKVSDFVFPTGLRRPPSGWRRFIAWFVRPTPEPSIWDWIVTAGIMDGGFVVLEFDDGTKVAGTYARGGLAMTSPEKPGIYLSEEWAVDSAGNIYAQVPNTRGVVIPDVGQVRTIRILR